MFHPGEQQAQQKAGYSPVRPAIYPAMPEQHRRFYQQLQTFYLAAIDESGYPVAALLQEEAGLLHTPDERHLSIALRSLERVSWLPALTPGTAVGGLGIDLSTRRRNRVNAVVESHSTDRLRLRVQECFGNCPQYIQRRLLPEPVRGRTLQVEPLEDLDADARYLIAAADTFFVGSYAPRQGDVGGVDISHRGGLPGFITLQQGKLRIPDYAGNRYMNTLGNLLVEPRCALLIMDFHQGAALHIQGRAAIQWCPPVEGVAERFWTVEPQRVLRLRQLLPPAGLAVEYADSTLATFQR